MLDSLVRQRLEEAPAEYANVPARDKGETRSLSRGLVDCCIVGGGPAGLFLALLRAVFRFAPGSLLVLMDHFDHWQVGYIIRRGGYRQLLAAGIPVLRRSVAELASELADRVGELKDWNQGSLLSVEPDRLSRWYRPGLLLIGDAAHVTSPVGGVGINLAIQDAVVAANVLAEPLKDGRLRPQHLKAVQRRREWPTRLVQGAQVLAERWVVSGALDTSEMFKLSLFVRFVLRMPLLRDLFARLVAFGAWPVHARASTASACSSSSLRQREGKCA